MSLSEESLKQFGITTRTTRKLMSLFDADKDGEVSRPEILALHRNVDGDGNGTLSKKELKDRAGAGNRGPRGFSPDELEAAMKRELSELEKSGADEKVSAGEGSPSRKKL